MQERRRANLGDLECVEVGVVDHQGLARLLDVDHELGLEVARDDGGHPRFGVVFLRAHDHASRADDLERLQRVALHDHVLRRPEGAGDGQFVGEVTFLALVLAGVDRTRLETDAHLGHVVGRGHPQVDHVDLGVAPDHEEVAPRSRGARDVHRIAGLDDVDDLLGVAVDQRDFTGIAQCGRENVLDVVVVHLLLRPIGRRDDDLPGRLHLRHAELGWHRRVLLHVAGHDVDRFLVHLARGQPIRHAGGRTVGDEDLQVIGALADREVWRQRLAGGAFAQHAVAARAAFEVGLAAEIELGLRHLRRFRVGTLVHRHFAQRRGTGLVRQLGWADGLLVLSDGQQRGCSEQQRERNR